MRIRSYDWLIAGLLAVSGHYSIFLAINMVPQILIERSGGPAVTVIGSKVFAELESKQEVTKVEDRAERKVGKEEKVEKKIEQVEKEKPKPIEKVIKKKPEKALDLETPKKEVDSEKALAAKQEKKPDPVKKEVAESKPEPVKKKVEKTLGEQPKKVKKKKVEKAKVEKRKKITKAKKSNKEKKAPNKRNLRRAGSRTVSQKKGGGRAGRQNKVSGNTSITNYKGRLYSHLQRYKRNPKGDTKRRGRVSVKFSISRSGNVISARLSGSSGIKELDREAVATVRRASPFPKVPNAMNAPLTITVPITYRTR